MKTQRKNVQATIDAAVKQLRRSERGQNALKAVQEMIDGPMSGLDAQNKTAVLNLLEAAFSGYVFTVRMAIEEDAAPPTESIEDIGDDFEIGFQNPREDGCVWVQGYLNGVNFDALVFPEHAAKESYELDKSKISKLWIKRIADEKIVFNFDRGMDVAAADETTQKIVDFLCAGLAFHVFGE